jgi:hypothetical protein
VDHGIGSDWKEFKRELHQAIGRHGAGNVKIVGSDFIYAEAGGEAVTNRYAPDILSAGEIERWRDTLGLL